MVMLVRELKESARLLQLARNDGTRGADAGAPGRGTATFIVLAVHRDGGPVRFMMLHACCTQPGAVNRNQL